MNLNSDTILDTVKVATAMSPPALTAFGIGLEDWMYIVSITAGILLVLERVPRVWRQFRNRKNDLVED